MVVGADGDPNYILGNPGFEIEIILATAGGSAGVNVNDVDGTTSGSSINSYALSTNHQRSNALNGDPSCASQPIFMDFFIPFSDVGILPTDEFRLLAATASSAGSALGGSASDIGGVDGDALPDEDDQFTDAIDNFPPTPFINNPPVANDATVSIDENSANGTTVHSVVATDPENNITDYSITGGNGLGGFTIDPSTGEITVADASVLDFETNPTFSLEVTVMDAGGLTDMATITVNLNDLSEVINTPPLLKDQSFTITESSILNGDLLLQASDPEGDNLVINTTPVDITANGTLIIGTDGTFTYTPNPYFIGTDSFSFKVCDDGDPSLCTQANISIVVIASDSDGDGISDSDEIGDDPANPKDTDKDGVPDYLDSDDDGDGLLTSEEDGNGDGNLFNDDCNEDFIPDFLDEVSCLVVPELGFSPDGDGNNDGWIINGIEEYSQNKVSIFNRWGNLVFEINGYDNNTRIWNGDAKNGLVIGQQSVPDGTYYYVIDLGDGSKPLSGYVIIKR